MNPDAKKVYQRYPQWAQEKLLSIRHQLFQLAQEHDDIGEIQETLKWGEPSYLTIKPKTGSTVRLAWHQHKPDVVGIYFNCKTSLIAQIEAVYGASLDYEGNRAILFSRTTDLPLKWIKHCLLMALTYHIR